jgi:predicted membrane protein
MNNANKNQSRKIRRNTIVFAILMILAQIGASAIYGATFRINHGITSTASVTNIIGLAILVIAGNNKHI